MSRVDGGSYPPSPLQQGGRGRRHDRKLEAIEVGELQLLGKDVAEVVSRCHTNQQEDTRFHLTSDEMETDVDVLAPVVVDLVAREEEDDPRVGGLWRNTPRCAAERDVLSQLCSRGSLLHGCRRTRVKAAAP